MIRAAGRLASRTRAAQVSSCLLGALLLGSFAGESRASAACDECSDLCRLLDQHQQRQKGVELWRKYAESTDQADREALPANVTETNSLQNHVKAQFDAWAADRMQKLDLPCELPKQAQTNPAPVVTDLTTTSDSSCEIQYQGKGLFKDDNLKQFETAVGCKTLSDATIAHEEVHREHCMRAYADEEGLKTLDAPEFVAENELQAWTKHRDVLRDAIRPLALKCGWVPTKRQRLDLSSVPSNPQMRKMEKRWKRAAKALKRKRRTP